MLRKLGITFVLLLTSHLLAAAGEHENIGTLTCNNNNKAPVTNIWRGNEGRCECSSPSSGASSSGYNYTKIGAHKLHFEKKTWNEARKVCIEEGSHLAIIDSEAEAQMLLDLIKRKYDRIDSLYFVIWVGMHDLFQEGDWITIFGHHPNFDAFDKSGKCLHAVQPDNDNRTDPYLNCAALYVPCKYMVDFDCSSEQGFICEKPETCE